MVNARDSPPHKTEKLNLNLCFVFFIYQKVISAAISPLAQLMESGAQVLILIQTPPMLHIAPAKSKISGEKLCFLLLFNTNRPFNTINMLLPK